MTRRIGGAVRDAAIRARRAVPKLAERALTADAATTATTATTASEAELAYSVSPLTPRGDPVDGSAVLLLLGEGDRPEPFTFDQLCAYLETRYTLTPIP